jgi:hypothetical protein
VLQSIQNDAADRLAASSAAAVAAVSGQTPVMRAVFDFDSWCPS